MKRRQLLLAAAAGVARPALAAGPGFPSRDVHIIVPSNAGSVTDIVAREVGVLLQRQWDTPVVVENISGAGSQLATQKVASSKPDGHTIQLTNTALFTNPAFAPSLPYDTLADLQGVTALVGVPSYLAVRASLGWQTLDDLLAASRKSPGTYSFGSSGPRSGPHIGMALLADMAKVRWLHVPYRGLQELILDLLAERIDMALLTRGAALAGKAAGKLQVVAATEPLPWADAAGLPVLSRIYPEYRYRGIFGLVVPSATPRAVVDRIHAGAKVAIAELEQAGKLRELGVTPQVTSPDEFQATIREQVQLWRVWNQRLQLD